MKVVQTIGKRGDREGVFRYRRDRDGVVVVPLERGDEGEQAQTFRLTHEEWGQLVDAFYAFDRSVRLSGRDDDSAFTICRDAVPEPENGFNWTTSHSAYVVAVLEHEGTVDLTYAPDSPIRVIRDRAEP